MSSHEERRASSTGDARLHVSSLLVVLVAALCGLFGASAYVRFFAAHIGHDQAWGLYLGMQVLDGVKLNGPYLVEVNPPFIVWFMALPVLISRHLHLDVIAGFRYFLVVTGALAVAWAIALFKRLQRTTALALWVFILLQVVVYGLAIPTLDLGQREYFVSLFLLPYLLDAALRIERRRLSLIEGCLVGLLACVAICLKPQHILDVGFVELLILIRLRRLREWIDPSWMSVAVGLILYLLSVHVFAPAYLNDLVPLLKETYWGFNVQLRTVVHPALLPILVFMIAVALYLLVRRRLRTEPLVAVLLTASFGAGVAYFQQDKGWPYQLMCFEVFAFLALGLIGSDLLQRWMDERPNQSSLQRNTGQLVLVSLVVFLVSLFALGRHKRQAPYEEPHKQVLADVFSMYPKGSAVTYLSIAPWEFPALVEQQKTLGTRYLHLWLLPSLTRSMCAGDSEAKHHLSPDELSRLSTLFRTQEAEDLAHFKPVVVITEPYIMPQYCTAAERAHFGSLMDWFQAEPQFREQWSHYKYQKTVDGLDVFTRAD